jgi:hypothetical protein
MSAKPQSGLLDPQARDRPSDHQLLDLFSPFKNVVDLPRGSLTVQSVPDKRVRSPRVHRVAARPTRTRGGSRGSPVEGGRPHGRSSSEVRPNRRWVSVCRSVPRDPRPPRGRDRARPVGRTSAAGASRQDAHTVVGRCWCGAVHVPGVDCDRRQLPRAPGGAPPPCADAGRAWVSTPRCLRRSSRDRRVPRALRPAAAAQSRPLTIGRAATGRTSAASRSRAGRTS